MAGISYSVNAATDISVEIYPDGTVQTCKFSLSAHKKKFTDMCTTNPNPAKNSLRRSSSTALGRCEFIEKRYG
jgi:hypothetical protein